MANILLAENDTTLRSLMEIALRAEGHRVHSAANGSELMELGRRELPDLVIIDLFVPRLAESRVIAELRRLHPGTGIIALSIGPVAMGDLSPSLALQNGADEVLAKPFPLSELRAVIQRVLARAGGSPRKAP